MELKPGNFCPLIKADCKGIECTFFTQVQGVHPSTGVPTSEWGCAIAWLPFLLIENSNMQRQTGAAVDQLNTNVVQQNMQTQALTMLGMRIPNNENVTYELMPSNTGIVD